MIAEIEAFGSVLAQARRASRNTVASYRRDLRDFNYYLLGGTTALAADGKTVDAGRVTADHVRNYFAGLINAWMSRAT
ncbi:MAG TPA: site-specific integrase, partial [Candidatus Binataceae bacterium]|nr:site-specific integrase [Candidatus Binataceae bacterium]